MTSPALYAVSDGGPTALEVAPGASGFDELYDGLELGVYTSLRTYQRFKFLHLEDHLQRLRDSMTRLRWRYELDEPRLRRALHRVCSAYPAPEMRVRIDVLAAPAAARGVASRELVALVPFTPPPRSVYEHGVAVRTLRGLRRQDPLAKTADFVEQRKRVVAGATDAYEHLLIDDDGRVLEGTSSNFYGVTGGMIHTAGEGVLEGVTRRIVLALAAARGVIVDLHAVHADAIPGLEEAGISSSSRGLVPVVRIDDVELGEGRPGPVLSGLSRDYEAFVADTVRPAVEV